MKEAYEVQRKDAVSKILIVDDEEYIRDVLGEILDMEGYRCTLAPDASEARKRLEEEAYDLILCDIRMPGESGLDFIEDILKRHEDTAAVMVSGMDDPLIAEAALKIGVYDYIIKPFDVNAVLISVTNALRRRQLEIDNRNYRQTLEKMVSERTASLQDREARLRAIFEAAEHVAFIMTDRDGEDSRILEFSPGAERLLGFEKEEVVGWPIRMLGLPREFSTPLDPEGISEKKKPNLRPVVYLPRKSGERVPALSTAYPIFNAEGKTTANLFVAIDISERIEGEKKLQHSMENLRKALEGTVMAIARTLETRDPYTAGHEQRVAELAYAIGKEMALSASLQEGIRMAALIHDLGKIAIPAGILNKPGMISDIELDLIKTHPKVGYNILKDIEFPWPLAEVVLQHHERLDGSGYPSGLRRDDILIQALILGVSDVVEAMATHRPYRPAFGLQKALEHIASNKGVLYDERVVEACLRLFNEKGFKFPEVPENVRMIHL